MEEELGRWVKKKYGRTEYLSAGERHEHKLELQRKWRAKNIEKVRKYARDGMKRRRMDFPEQVRAYKKQQYLKHRDYYIQKSKEWRLNNRLRYNAKLREIYKRTVEYRKRPKCVGCECILKENEKLVCLWCIYTYPHKYKHICKIIKN